MGELAAAAAENRGAILALDTTTRAGSIAWARRGIVEDLFVGDAARSHGERLPGDIRALLDRAGARVEDIELFAIVNGPGSFTGLRVGIAAIQGLAMATGRSVVAVPALDALAASPSVRDGRVGVWMDAQRKQVFAAVYDKRLTELNRVADAVSWTPERVIQEWTERQHAVDYLVGDGIDLYADRVREAWPGVQLITPAPPLAPIAAWLAATGAYPAVPPHAVVPIYVRPSDAEIARDRTGQRSDA